MFEVLVYVYENYWHGAACPDSDLLERKLSAAGFDTQEIRSALDWLDDLNLATQNTHSRPWHAPAPAAEQAVPIRAAPTSMRVYSVAEQNQLGTACLGFISFLESASALPVPMREIVIDRAMAVPDAPVSLDDLRIIILMVYWSFGEEPEALILDELCATQAVRTCH